MATISYKYAHQARAIAEDIEQAIHDNALADELIDTATRMGSTAWGEATHRHEIVQTALALICRPPSQWAKLLKASDRQMLLLTLTAACRLSRQGEALLHQMAEQPFLVAADTGYRDKVLEAAICIDAMRSTSPDPQWPFESWESPFKEK